MGSQRCKHDSVMQTKPSNKRCATCPSDDRNDIHKEPSKEELSELNLHASSPVLHEIEEFQSIPPTPLDPTTPEETKSADLVTSVPLTPAPLTPHPVAPSKSIWATLLASLGFRSLAGSVNKNNENHKDRHRPELKNEEDEEKPTKEINAEMAAKRHDKKPLCKYGTHRKLDRTGYDKENKICKFHKIRKGEDKKEDDCQ